MAKRQASRKSKRASTAPRRKRAGLPPLSRSLLEKMVTDLVGRIRDQLQDAQAIAKVAAPTGQTLHCEWQIRRVIELAMNVHVGELAGILGFAKLIERRPAVQS